MHPELTDDELRLLLQAAGWVSAEPNYRALFSEWPPQKGSLAYDFDVIDKKWECYAWVGSSWTLIPRYLVIKKVLG